MGLKSILGKVNQKYKAYQADSDNRANRKLEQAKSSAEREKVRAEIQKERAKMKQQVAEAKTATLKAEAARKKAQKELSDLSPKLGGLLDRFAPPKKRAKYRKVVTRKTPVRKPGKRQKRRKSPQSFRIVMD